MKVDLPPRIPLEMEKEVNNQDDNLTGLFNDVLRELPQCMYNIQPLTHRLTQTADAAEIIVNNQRHPSEVSKLFYAE